MADEIFKRAIQIFGIDNQIRVAAEESVELAVELLKGLRKGFTKERIEKIAEELADVEITSKYIRALVGDSKVDDYKANKLADLLKLLKREENKKPEERKDFGIRTIKFEKFPEFSEVIVDGKKIKGKELNVAIEKLAEGGENLNV